MAAGFEGFIQELNHDLGLQLSPQHQRLSFLSVSPSQDEDLGRQIYSELQHHHNTDRSAFLQSLEDFRIQARRQLKHWVPKPLADSDTLPASADNAGPRAPHGARNASERAALYISLREIMGRTRKGATTKAVRSSKRLSDEHSNGPSKRTRATPADAVKHVHLHGIDLVPSRVRSLHPQPLPSRLPQASRALYSHPSASTSRTSFPSEVFSVAEELGDLNNPTPYSSQDTNANVNRKFSQEYDLSPEAAQAFEESFSIHEDQPVQEEQSMLKDQSMLEGQSLLDGQLWLSPSFGRESTPTPDTAMPVFTELGPRFEGIWPALPEEGLNEAPLAVTWEITRAALHCGLDLRNLKKFQCPDTEKLDQKTLWARLREHPLFANSRRSLPPPSSTKAWEASLSNAYQADSEMVVFKAELLSNPTDASGKAFSIKLHPPELQLGHRLDRRFGSDRFIELVVPAMNKYNEEDRSRVVRWLLPEHAFLGRRWRAFWCKSDKPHDRAKRGGARDLNVRPQRVFQERVYLFAVDGNDFFHTEDSDQAPSQDDASAGGIGGQVNRTRCSVRGLIDWALDLNNPNNAKQQTPKLFSRLALSLSRSYPAVVLQRHQIINVQDDILSPAGMVMNDGVGIMSRRLARTISEWLKLDGTRCAFQARIGSAKGVWIIDVDSRNLNDEEIWIKTYPSQRKWECGFEDLQHRTFEVKGWPKHVPQSAELNNQFIPVLESRAKDRDQMRGAIAQRLDFCLRQEMNAEKEALLDPRQLRQSVSSHPTTAFQGGLPLRDESRVALFLDHGFTIENRFLNGLIWKLRREKTEKLKEKMKIQIPCSAYLFIVADFWDVLEPDEVHISFSNKFSAEGSTEVPGFGDTLVEEMDVLVGRSPAHLPSDIQRVKAVSHPLLRKLKDVIVFSTKGSRPLADRLSGGDYDGDQAWVCWDRMIVDNFVNAEKDLAPPTCDFVAEGYLHKQRDTFEALLYRHGGQPGSSDAAYDDFLRCGLSFNMQSNMLGICTKYKERLCYNLELGVADPAALTLSKLLSDLVDQAKAGITFTFEEWRRFQSKKLKKPATYEEPEYQKDKASDKWHREMASGKSKEKRPHVLDFLKYQIADVIIDDALKGFEEALTRPKKPQSYDEDLTSLHSEMASWAATSRSGKTLMEDLQGKLQSVKRAWDEMANVDSDFNEKVQTVHQMFMAIEPPKHLKNSRTIHSLNEAWIRCPSAGDRNRLRKPGEVEWDFHLSRWSLIKASTLFKLYYNNGETMCWHIAGRQLLHIKANVACSKERDTMAMLVVPWMYEVLKPDRRAVLRAITLKKQSADESDSLAALEEVTAFDEEGTVIDDA